LEHGWEDILRENINKDDEDIGVTIVASSKDDMPEIGLKGIEIEGNRPVPSVLKIIYR
jgi:hypothetical protein